MTAQHTTVVDAPVGQNRSLLWINHFAVPPAEGGGTRHFEIGRELLGRGWDVTIAAADYHYQSRRYIRRQSSEDRRAIPENIEGVRFLWLWSAPYTTNNWRRVWNWFSFALQLLSRHTSTSRRDVVIGSSPHLFAAWGGLRLARRWRVPFILEVRDLWPESIVAAGGRKGVGYFLFRLLARYLYSRADRIVCLARGTMTQLEKYGISSDKLIYVPNGVDADAFTGVRAERRSAFTVIYAGAHGPANGLDVVLQAANRLRERDIRFLLVGDGAAKEQLMAQARELQLSNVEFRTPVPKARIPELFASVDAGLMVLRDTPLFAFGVSPNKLFDYFGAGLPVVCNVPGEVAAMLQAANAGEQARDSSAEGLADAILKLASASPADRARMGNAGREWVAREHGRPVLADRLHSALTDVVRR